MPRAIVGLGNPGPEYERTRHNAGWLLVDHLAQRFGFSPWRKGDQAMITSGTLRGVPVRLLKPMTWMNRSGDALRQLRSPGWNPSDDLLVLVDDVAFPPGEFRLRKSGSPGGHNGLRSIEAALQSREYARLRIGIGAKPSGWDDLADWVLGRFGKEESAVLDASLDSMADAVECWIHEGIELAMTRFNRAGG